MTYTPKVGDKVIASKNCESTKKGQVYEVKKIADDLCIGEYGNYTCTCYSSWLPYEKTWDTLCEGDEVKDNYGQSRRVLNITGKIIDLSAIERYTKEELMLRGFTIVQPEPIKEEIETLKIGDKTYNKQEVESALKDIKSLD